MSGARKEKLIHVVGGGVNQIPIVQKCKSLGLKVLVTDMHEDAPAKAYADLFEAIDTTNRQGTLRCAERHRIDYIVTDQTDVAVPTVAYVADTLGLPGIGYGTAIRFTNKYVMRKSLQAELGAHIPEYHFFDKAEDAIDFCEALQRCSDYLVKPVNSQGSKGVFVLSKRQGELSRLVSTAFKESAGRGVLVERYIRGFEYSAETFVRDGKVHNLTLTKKYHYSHNPCLDERNTFLGDVAPDLEEKIFSVNKRIIEVLGLRFGITHAEFKVENGQVYLMEIAARGAGGSISSRIIPFLTEFDCLGSLLRVLMGMPFEIAPKNYRERFAVLRFFNFPPGRVKKVHINEKMVQDLMFFSFDVKEGSTIPDIRDSRDRPGYFIVHGTNRDAVLSRERAVEAAVQIEYY